MYLKNWYPHGLKGIRINSNAFNKVPLFYFCKKAENDPKGQVKEAGENKERSQTKSQGKRAITHYDLKVIYKANEEKIKDNTFYLSLLPDPNDFGEALLFHCSSGSLEKRMKSINIETSGAVTLTAVTMLNYFSLIFPSTYLFPYLLLITATSYFRLYKKIYYRNVFAVKLNLVNEHEIRFTYLNGESEVVDIKNVYIPHSYLERLNKLMERSANEDSKGMQQAPILITVKIKDERDCILVIRESNILNPYGTKDGFADIVTLLGIFNKKTRRLALTEDQVKV